MWRCCDGTDSDPESEEILAVGASLVCAALPRGAARLKGGWVLQAGAELGWKTQRARSAVHLQVSGQDQSGAAGGFGAVDEARHEVAVLHDVELEPEGLGRLLGHVLNRVDAHGGEDERDAELFGCECGFDLAVSAHHAAEAAWGESDWHGYFLSDHC